MRACARPAAVVVLSLAASACERLAGPDDRGGGLRARWHRSQAGTEVRARPAVLGDLVYFGTGDGYVVAREWATGARRWGAAVSRGTAVQGANLVARAGVVVAPLVRRVVALDAATGRERWRYDPPPDTVDAGPRPAPGQVVLSHVDADDATVYVPAWGASVSALDLRTGAARWVWQPGHSPGDPEPGGVYRSGSMGVRVSGDTVFATVWHALERLAGGLVGASESWLVALDRGTGRELWRAVLPGYPPGGVIVAGAPAIHGNFVLVATDGGHVWAIDRATQQVAWHFTPRTEYVTLTQVEVYGGVAYADGGDRRLYGLRAADGTVLWSADATNGATRDLLVTERRVYYPTAGKLHVFDRATGRRLATARVRVDGDIFESPAAFADGRVFVTATDGAWSFDEP
jgi:outer membrane protein assembly factor BamB